MTSDFITFTTFETPYRNHPLLYLFQTLTANFSSKISRPPKFHADRNKQRFEINA